VDGFATVERALYIASQTQGIDVAQEIAAAMEVVQFPQSSFRPVPASIGAELADDHTLAGDLPGERGQDVPDVVLLGENQLRVGLAAGFQQKCRSVVGDAFVQSEVVTCEFAGDGYR
jgi:hypothetical protein